ncbi:MAG TPA: TSUP family transporter [Polyangiaceae bacterium]
MVTACLAFAAFCTAVLSGIFGMAGGMILMGVYTALLPVPAAMVMHGGTQLLSNTTRGFFMRRHVYWRGFCYYLLGALCAFTSLLGVRYTPDPWLVFVGLGLSPFIAALLPRGWLDFQDSRAAVVTGFQVTAVQLLAGAAGPLLDVAFVDSKLDRNQVVATKAVTQVLSHALKLAYFLPIAETSGFSPGLVVALLLATLAGTWLGTGILARLTDDRFRRYSRRLLLAIGGVYLLQAAMLILADG